VSTVVQGPLYIGEEGVALSPNAGWGWTNWVEVEDSMPGPGALAGLHLGGDAQTDLEIDVGIGPAGSESSVGIFRCAAMSLTGIGFYDLMLPVPLDVLTQYARVAVRARSDGSSDPTVALSYYPEATFSNKTRGRISSVPAGADSVSLALTGVAWDWSAWETLTDGEESRIGIYGLAAATDFLTDTIFEVQLGIGAEGVESEIGTYRYAHPNYWGHILLPIPHAVAPFTRVAFRIRAHNTETIDLAAALLFYDRVDQAVIGPLAWLHWPRRLP
jgi:hypothetical protein